MTGSVTVNDDGSLNIVDESGAVVPQSLVDKVKKQYADEIRDMLGQKCDQINAEVEALGEIHQHTPDPSTKPTFVAAVFPTGAPACPPPRPLSLLDRLLGRRERREREYATAIAAFERDLRAWEGERDKFAAEQARLRQVIEKDIYSDPDAMERHLSEVLQEIVWPRETMLTFDILDGGSRVVVDVDLPEIEQLPNKTASVPQRGLRLSIKEMSPTQHQRLYMRHVHGIGFRIIGEIFAALPTVQLVVLSAYSQRPDPATGAARDDYLYSARVPRDRWQRIRFDNLATLDVVEALSQFELRREMGKTGAFKPIEPFAA